MLWAGRDSCCYISKHKRIHVVSETDTALLVAEALHCRYVPLLLHLACAPGHDMAPHRDLEHGICSQCIDGVARPAHVRQAGCNQLPQRKHSVWTFCDRGPKQTMCYVMVDSIRAQEAQDRYSCNCQECYMTSQVYVSSDAGSVAMALTWDDILLAVFK